MKCPTVLLQPALPKRNSICHTDLRNRICERWTDMVSLQSNRTTLQTSEFRTRIFFFFGTSTILEKYEARSILWLKSYLFPNSMKSILFSYYCPLHVVRVSEDRHTFSAPLGSESINREWWYIFCVNSVIGRTFDSVVVTWNNVPLNSCRPPELRVYEAASRVQRSAVAMQISGVDITAVRAERKYGASDWRHK